MARKISRRQLLGAGAAALGAAGLTVAGVEVASFGEQIGGSAQLAESPSASTTASSVPGSTGPRTGAGGSTPPVSAGQTTGTSTAGLPNMPNIVMIYVDDLGYGDLSCYGSPLIESPHLDALAKQGTRFTQGYCGAPVCSPSRAALLTGRVPPRTGVSRVIFPQDTIGLNASERTVAHYLRDAGYFTAAVGKWHLGNFPDYLPGKYGFDSYFGVDAVYTSHTYPVQVWRDDALIEEVTDSAGLAALTSRFTDEAVKAIDAAGGRPFFLYLAETSPHEPLVVDPAGKGVSKAGLYGDVVQWMDKQLGRLFTALAERGLDKKTLVLFASDNGPWWDGSTGGLRGAKFDVAEGGVRVPFIARWPGIVPAGHTSDEIVTVLDLLPTACALAGVEPDVGRTVDGASILDVLQGKRSGGSHPPVYYYSGTKLSAIRQGNLKLQVRRSGSDQTRLPALYDLSVDPSEAYNLADDRPADVARMRVVLDNFSAQVEG